MTIASIQDKIKSRGYRFSEHVVKRMIERNIDRREVEEAIFSGEVIEEYPDDKYSPSCLVYGGTGQGRHLHVQVTLPPKVVIITVYEPNCLDWVDYRLRR